MKQTTQFFLEGESPTLNKKFLLQSEWFIANKLSIYSGENKTTFILFSKIEGLKEDKISFA